MGKPSDKCKGALGEELFIVEKANDYDNYKVLKL